MKKEIKIARIDLSNKALVEKLRAYGLTMAASDEIMIVKDGQKYGYDGPWHDARVLIHHMQRVANPLVNLTSVKQIVNFVEDAADDYILDEDYAGGLL